MCNQKSLALRADVLSCLCYVFTRPYKINIFKAHKHGYHYRSEFEPLLFRLLRSQLISNKHGITITSNDPFKDGKVTLCVENTFEVFLLLVSPNESS